MMIEPPRMDVLSRADDARLGLYVVARLAASLGVKVELRPSSFGGTRVVVLIPTELVLTEDQLPPSASDEDDAEAGAEAGVGVGVEVGVEVGVGPGSRIPSIAASTDDAAEPLSESPPEPSEPSSSVLTPEQSVSAPAFVSVQPVPSAGPAPLDPLPRRVRQASLAKELRAPRAAADAASPAAPAPPSDAHSPIPAPRPGGTVGATVGAFQRQSRLARLARLADDGEKNTEEGER